MEEDNTPIPSLGRRKSLMLGADGSVVGEKPLLSEGRKELKLGLDHILLCQVPNLSALKPSVNYPNSAFVKNTKGEPTKYNKLVGPEDCIIYEHVRDSTKARTARAFLRAGPRGALHFDPTKVNAAIVTSGSLSPGLNSVIHHLVQTLKLNYEANKIYGVSGGYSGFHDPDKPVIELDKATNLEFLQHRAGSILGCSAGGFDINKIMDFLITKEISHLYVIGGDGTHRGAHRIAVECIARDLNIAVAGIPKSIDNDIDLIDRSFGFMTAVEAAQDAIRSATIEAKCNLPNGIGIVKLMGRSAGYIAAYSVLASGDVDLCLVPEVEVKLHGPTGCLPHIEEVVSRQGYAVIVVAEGAGESLLNEQQRNTTGSSSSSDDKKSAAAASKGGSNESPAFGLFLKTQIEKHFVSKGKQATVKYIDPSYMIRSVAANSFDQIQCMQLAQNAVHGAMAGYTAFSAGVINNRTVFIPITELVENSPKAMNPRGRTWERVLTITRQPNTYE